jgi:hypothetical protein
LSLEYIIYTDESDKRGRYFSNFYGGVLVRSYDLPGVVGRLETCKSRLFLRGEVKWQKVTKTYLEKYEQTIDAFFDEVAADRMKVRIMFTNNQYVPQGLNAEQRKNEYHLLYYQFIKHSFGLQHSAAERSTNAAIRLNIDQMPTSREETAQFKAFLIGLNRIPSLRRAGIRLRLDQIAEVCSHEHVILQCLDIVLGAMSFRLNDKQLEKPAGAHRRANRTLAKEKLYRHILKRIRQIYPNFNIGETTGTQHDFSNRWRHPYRHWKLIPKDHRRDLGRAKK